MTRGDGDGGVAGGADGFSVAPLAVEDLGLSADARAALRAGGRRFTTWLAARSPAEVRDLPGVGAGGVYEITLALARHGRGGLWIGTEEDRRMQMMCMRQAGATFREIGEHHSVSREWARRIINEPPDGREQQRQASRRHEARRTLQAQLIAARLDEWRALYRRGGDVREAAKKLGLPRERAAAAVIATVTADDRRERRFALAYHRSGAERAATRPLQIDALRLSSPVRAALEAAGEQFITWLAGRSPRELRDLPGVGPAGVYEITLELARLERGGLPLRTAEDRRVQMTCMRAAGATLQAIADHHRLTKQRVRQIIGVATNDTDNRRARRHARGRARVAAHVDELRSIYRDGGDISAAARARGLPVAPTLDVMKDAVSAQDRAARRGAFAHTRSTGTRDAADPAVRRAFREAADRHGLAVPTAAQYAAVARARRLPGPRALAISHGSWPAVLHAAGVTADLLPVRTSGRRREWDDGRCRDAVARVVGELGRWPSRAEYATWAANRADLPSAATLRNRLGTWTAIGLASVDAAAAASSASAAALASDMESSSGNRVRPRRPSCAELAVRAAVT